MSQRIVLTSSKGGTGKTTTALNLAVALAERGRTTVVVDLDPQGAIGLFLAQEDSGWSGLAEVMIAGASPSEVMVATSLPTLRILPRGRIDPIDAWEFELQLHREGRLAGILDEVEDQVDYTILDTPSGLGPVTRAALAAAHWALLPLQAEPASLRTLGQTLRVLDHVRQHENPELRLLGILPTMVQLDQDPSLNVMSAVWSGFGGVLDTVIPRSEVFVRATEIGIPLSFLGGSIRPEARRFTLLSDEIEARINAMTGVEDDKEHRRLV